ncbi:MAG: PAS domain S-box protein [Candidatus Gracilibacteria bacterium]|nr:PAS domain S-box protein [Candidatus Gracilibacteria bacterium]
MSKDKKMSEEDKRKNFMLLVDSEKLFRSLFANAIDAMVILDKKGEFMEVNNKTEELLGYSREEILGRKLSELDLLTPESKVTALKNFVKRMAGFTIHPYELEFVHKDGTIIVGELNAAPLEVDGRIVGDLIIIRDLTERKKREQRMREQENEILDLLENSNDLIQSVDAQGNFIYVNQKWQEVLGYSKDEAQCLNLQEVLAPDQIAHCMEVFAKVQQGESFSQVPTVFIAKDGKKVSVEGSVNSKIVDGKFVSTRGIFRVVE